MYESVVGQLKALENDSALLADPLVRCALFSSLEKILSLDTALPLPAITALVIGVKEGQASPHIVRRLQSSRKLI